ncbi:MAG: hypothetical protein HYX57_10125 [Chloroflexi bacterium]|nr:hypothetical protein [Chloroflexota bacterium]
MRRVFISFAGGALLVVLSAGVAFGANCVNANKPDGAGQKVVVLITSFSPEEEIVIGANAAGRWRGGFVDVYFDADGSGTLTQGDPLLINDTFLVANHSFRDNPAQTDPSFGHAVLPPVLNGADPGGAGRGVDPGF